MIERDSERAKSFTRRAFVIGAGQGLLLGVLGARLGWLQLVQGQRYRMLAENNRINIRLLEPSRGLIVDRYGNNLAINDQNFRVIVVPEQTKDLKAALTAIGQRIELDERDIQRAIKQARKQASFMPVEVKENLDWDQVSRIEVSLTDLPGVSIDEGEIRFYPLGATTAHITGYVGAVSKAELGDEPLLAMPGFRVGKGGIEKTYDKELRGTAGTAEIEVNVVGREVRELNRYSGTAGKKVWLTIDAELQTYVYQRLAPERSASAVIMDIKTGAVYALVSYPAFDPNVFTRGLSPDKWEELLNDPALPLNNKALSGQYPPGSTFKMVTAMALLEEGIINRNTPAFCPGHYDFGDNRFHCWKRPGHGSVNVIEALSQSCDTFFYKNAIELGIDRLAAYAERLGLGSKLGFEMAEERPGMMPTKAWKLGQMGQSWQPGETIVASIGQGYTLATPLQLAVMTSRLVNGGFAVKPWLTGAVGSDVTAEKTWPSMGFKQANIDIIKQGMVSVINNPRGTAFSARIKDPAMAMGGKTGTAQVRRITKEQRAQGITEDKLPWRLRHHALFVGYAPLDNPRYACAVVVEHGGGGSSVAAPIARDLMMAVQQRNPAMTTIVPDADPANIRQTFGGG